jgi:hypothetical protein
MNKNPFVLKALKILGLEEMLKLAEILNSKAQPMKKAAGEDLIVWNEPEAQPTPKKKEHQHSEAKILSFKAPKPTDEELEAKAEQDKIKENPIHLVTAEMMMWQKELTKDSEVSLQKRDAMNGYKKSTEMYVVKTTEVDGKEKIRIASTRGVLVDKKQA